MSKRLSEELKDAVVSDYLSGVTSREIIKKHKTYELYSILKERDIEYKQDNDTQKEKYKKVIELYHTGLKIDDIITITGCKDVYKILVKFGITRKREPKDYNTNKKEERNIELIEDYKSKEYSFKLNFCSSGKTLLIGCLPILITFFNFFFLQFLQYILNKSFILSLLVNFNTK